jgi:hypothetical protein
MFYVVIVVVVVVVRGVRQVLCGIVVGSICDLGRV